MSKMEPGVNSRPGVIMSRRDEAGNTQNEKRKRNESVREYQITLDMEMSSWRRQTGCGSSLRIMLHWWQILRRGACLVR